MDGKQYTPVFSQKAQFAKFYSMYSMRNSGDALIFFCKEFCEPEKLISDGFKEQMRKGATFMKEVYR